MLAKEVLHEIPNQLVSWMTQRGIKPLPQRSWNVCTLFDVLFVCLKINVKQMYLKRHSPWLKTPLTLFAKSNCTILMFYQIKYFHVRSSVLLFASKEFFHSFFPFWPLLDHFWNQFLNIIFHSNLKRYFCLVIHEVSNSTDTLSIPKRKLWIRYLVSTLYLPFCISLWVTRYKIR